MLYDIAAELVENRKHCLMVQPPDQPATAARRQGRGPRDADSVGVRLRQVVGLAAPQPD